MVHISLTDTAETAEFMFLKKYSFCAFLQNTDKGIANEDKNDQGGMCNRRGSAEIRKRYKALSYFPVLC